MVSPHKKILSRANKRISLGGAAALLVGATLIGQVLGFLRLKLINANFDEFGHQSTDAFFAAFKLPDFFFYTIAAGALGVAFIPILNDHLHKHDRKGAWELAVSLLNLLAIFMAIVGVIILVFAEPLVHIVAPGIKSQEQINTAATIMRLIAFNPLLFTLSGILTAIQQTVGRFFFFAIAPFFYNGSIIVAALIFSTVDGKNGGPGGLGLVGLGIGALIGAILQLLVILFGMYGTEFNWKPRILKTRDFKLVLKRLPARSIDQGIDSINSIAETGFASRLPTGSITYYENAYTLHTVPIALVGTTISTAAFPRLTERLSAGRPDLFRKDFLIILRAMIWIMMPIIVISYFARGYLARMIFAQGLSAIALIFGYLVGAIFFRTLYSIISRWFYAQKDTKTPLFVSLFVIALNIFLAYKLSQPDSYGIAGLAMAQSIVAAVEVVILTIIMLIRDRKLFDAEFWHGILRILSVTGFSVLAAFVMISLLPLNVNDRGIITLGSKLGAIALVTFGVHVAISLIFDLREAKPVIARMKQVMLKPVRLVQ
jgi:putative peptidoglycan lipid II flippase